MTDDEIEALAKKHICPHHDRLDAILANRVPYQQTEQFRRVKALIADVLSKLRAPVADEQDEPTAPDDDAIAECWVSASDIDGIAYDGPSFERGYRAALASAPVVDSWTPTPANINALPEPVRAYIHALAANAPVTEDAIAWREVDRNGHAMTCWYDGNPGVNPVPSQASFSIQRAYAAPQASEAVRDALETLIREAQAFADDYHRPRYARLDEAIQSARAALSAQPGAQKGDGDGDERK